MNRPMVNMVNSSKKGGRFERWLSRELSEWGTGSREPPELWRSVQSGGWKYRGIPDVGDLMPKGEWGREFRSRFAVEAKNRSGKNLDFWHFWTRSPGKLAEWWRKIKAESYDHDLCPWLVVRRSHYTDLLGYPASFGIKGCKPRIRVVGEGLEFSTLEQVLQSYNWQEMKELYGQWI